MNYRSTIRWFAGCVLVLALGWAGARAAEVMPPRPPRYFNDYAGVISADTSSRLNKTLEDFERETSNQILVVIYPHMQSDSSIEDYTVRMAQAWGVGQKQKNNGAVLFVFTQDRKMYIQVGYGLEGALPDALAKQIIENELKPHFRNGDFNGGLSAGVAAILAATRGEYKGTGRTVAEQQQMISSGGVSFAVIIAVIIFLLVFYVGLRLARASKGAVYHRGGYFPSGGWTSSSSNWSGGGWGGGSSGGGFSGGGGSFGGGGAGGSW